MADPSGRTNSLRIPRGRKRSTSSRSNNGAAGSGNSSGSHLPCREVPENAVNTHQLPHHPLRPMASRFSLNEHFAASRREYEFGDEDTSSVFFEMTTGDDVDADDEADVGKHGREDDPDADDEDDSVTGLDGDHYDTLCLPRGAALTRDQIRTAYYRLFLLFLPDSYPPPLRPVARRQFRRAQLAFETLVDASRRAQYDAALAAAATKRCAAADDDDDEEQRLYDDAWRVALWDKMDLEQGSRRDLGVRFDAQMRDRLQPPWCWRATDFSLDQAWDVDATPLLRRLLLRKPLRAGAVARTAMKAQPDRVKVELGTSRLSVAGSVYAVVDEVGRTPLALLADRYQPLMPAVMPRRRLLQLVDRKMAPLVAVAWRQEIRRGSSPLCRSDRLTPGHTDRAGPVWLRSFVTIESDVLRVAGSSSPGAHVDHHVQLSQSARPTIFETSITAAYADVTAARRPRVSLGARHPCLGGAVLLRLDSGDWTLRPPDACRFMTGFRRTVGAALLPLEFPLQTAAPRVELAFTTAEAEATPPPPLSPRLLAAGLTTRLHDGGLRGLDRQVRSGSPPTWTVSAAATASSAAASLRCSKDLRVFLPATAAAAAPSTPLRRPSRVEAELCASTFRQDLFLALRHLWPVSRLSNVGIELAVSPQSLHLSLCWSRLGHRLTLPLLIAPYPCAPIRLRTKLVFWAAVVPLAALAAWQFVLARSLRTTAATAVAPAVHRDAVARRRSAADKVTSLLGTPIVSRQKVLASKGGLVILSAKYGVPDARTSSNRSSSRSRRRHSVSEREEDEEVEVADVSIALAALAEDVDEGRIHIPPGVRKGRLPGFWDPAPGRDKVLRVRYLWRGREDFVEVRGTEELVLPPP